jgi:hypothetical protein
MKAHIVRRNMHSDRQVLLEEGQMLGQVSLGEEDWGFGLALKGVVGGMKVTANVENLERPEAGTEIEGSGEVEVTISGVPW